MDRACERLKNQILCAVSQHGREDKHREGARHRLSPDLLQGLFEVLLGILCADVWLRNGLAERCVFFEAPQTQRGDHNGQSTQAC